MRGAFYRALSPLTIVTTTHVMVCIAFHYFVEARCEASGDEPMPEITEILKAMSSGDKQAFDRLMPLVEKELKKIAHAYMRNERPGNILQTTALVNEALIKLIRENISYENRKHFYALVAKRMRQVLVDYAGRHGVSNTLTWIRHPYLLSNDRKKYSCSMKR